MDLDDAALADGVSGDVAWATPPETGRDAVELAAVGPAFEDLFEQERERLFRAVYAMTGDRQEAEDVTQEAFVRVLERWDRVGRMRSPAGYLHRTALNLVRNRYRRLVLSIRKAVRPEPQPDPYEPVEALAVVSVLLDALSPRQRTVMVLTDGLGYSAEEAARLMHVRGSTARVLHHQARRSLERRRAELGG